jgi:hypothetical protein
VRKHLTYANLMATVAVFVALGGGAYAATSGLLVGRGGVITGCVARNGGPLRVVKAGRKCPRGTVRLSFNQQGQPGKNGKNGANGKNGKDGAVGKTGPAGLPNPNATTVDGQTVTKLMLREPTPVSSMASRTLFSGGGLTILAQCDNAGNARLIANGPASSNAELTSSGWDNVSGFGHQNRALGPLSADSLSGGNSGQVSFSYSSSDGHVVTGNVGFQTAPSFGTLAECAFFGSVISS